MENTGNHHHALSSSNFEECLLQSLHLKELPLSLEARLQHLTDILESLSVADCHSSSYAVAIDQLSSEESSLSLLLNRLGYAEELLRDELAWTTHQRELFDHWNAAPNKRDDADSHVNDASELNTKIDTLNAKASEYTKELEELRGAGLIPVTISDLLSIKESIGKGEARIRKSREQLKVFEGLPPDVKLARRELEAARDEQMKLVALRERLLREMANSVS